MTEAEIKELECERIDQNFQKVYHLFQQNEYENEEQRILAKEAMQELEIMQHYMVELNSMQLAKAQEDNKKLPRNGMVNPNTTSL
jgi:predicted secreted protein